MKNKGITIEDLARMVEKGFGGTDKKIDKGFKEINTRFKEVDTRLNRIENIILKQYSQKIEILERRIKRLEETLAMK